MNYEGLLCGTALQRAKCCKGRVVKREEQNDMMVKRIEFFRSFSTNVDLIVFAKNWLTYICEDAVTLVANASLQTEGQVVAADHDAAAEALLERLHVRLDA